MPTPAPTEEAGTLNSPRVRGCALEIISVSFRQKRNDVTRAEMGTRRGAQKSGPLAESSDVPVSVQCRAVGPCRILRQCPDASLFSVGPKATPGDYFPLVPLSGKTLTHRIVRAKLAGLSGCLSVWRSGNPMFTLQFKLPLDLFGWKQIAGVRKRCELRESSCGTRTRDRRVNGSRIACFHYHAEDGTTYERSRNLKVLQKDLNNHMIT
ncbi:hypothetical protein RR46_12359 [Papilio xuthus]|uniref:Uncharacterized protein n=1 Tax=Papilio xuthus TaxID=66420 RepID=A0A194PU97_PAPXU|nr:hypothetical protein RR46_12359 [Papilio xuthus]